MCYVIMVETKIGVIYSLDKPNMLVTHGYYTGLTADGSVDNGARICPVKHPIVTSGNTPETQKKIKRYKSLQSAKVAAQRYADKIKEPARNATVFRLETIQRYKLSVFNTDNQQVEFVLQPNV